MPKAAPPSKKPFALLHLWYPADSSRVLGFGLSAEDAYRDAVSRHGPILGYSASVLLTDFPAGANPAPAIIVALREQWPPTLSEAGAPSTEENVQPINKKKKADAT